MEDVAVRIFNLLKQKNIEQKEFANILGTTDKKVSAWKTGRSKTYRDCLPQIASVLGTSVEYLLTGKTHSEASNTSSPASPALQRLSEALEELNEEGREKLLDYAADLVASGRYKKADPARLGQKA